MEIAFLEYDKWVRLWMDCSYSPHIADKAEELSVKRGWTWLHRL